VALATSCVRSPKVWYIQYVIIRILSKANLDYSIPLILTNIPGPRTQKGSLINNNPSREKPIYHKKPEDPLEAGEQMVNEVWDDQTAEVAIREADLRSFSKAEWLEVYKQ
jgi:hypothetical protein